MATKIGINGMGRIGSLALRAGLEYPDLEFVAVNDLTQAETLAYLFEFNSVHGTYEGSVEVVDDAIVVDGQPIRVFHEKDPAKIPWRDVGVDVVLESTGSFESLGGASKHLQAGPRKVVITAPADDVPTCLVMGVNEDAYQPDVDSVICMGSCTTYALAVVAKVLEEKFGIERAFVNTAHAYTNSQALLDRPAESLRRSRAGAVNIVPTTTGAVRAVGRVIPSLAGKLDGIALRVPVPDGSLIDLTCILRKAATVAQLHQAFDEATAREELAPYLATIDAPVVSSDIIGVDQSSIVDKTLTMASGHLAKVFSWYDNEWSFALRVCDVASFVGARLGAPVRARTRTRTRAS